MVEEKPFLENAGKVQIVNVLLMNMPFWIITFCKLNVNEWT